MPRERWTRDQDLAVLYLKLEHKGRSAIGTLADAMGRTEASILMRKGNFDSLDPSVPGRGLNHPAKLTVAIWTEYERDPKRVRREAQRAYLNLVRP